MSQTFPNTNTAQSASRIGYGSAFVMGVTLGGDTTYTQVAEVKEIKSSGITVGEEDVTSLGSPGMIREYIPTLAEYGKLEITGDYTSDASQAAMEAVAKSLSVVPFKFAYPADRTGVETRIGSGFYQVLDRGISPYTRCSPSIRRLKPRRRLESFAGH